MIRVVFFDLGDTLCDYGAAAAAALDRACKYAASQSAAVVAESLSAAYVREVRHAEEEMARWAASRLALPSGLDGGDELWARALEKCGVVSRELAHAVALQYELSRLRALQLLPEARATLQATRPHAAVGLIAEGSRAIVSQELTGLGLDDLLSPVVIAGQAGFFKRDPQLFLHAARQAGCTPGEAVHVGDSLAADVAPAQQAGLLTIWINAAGAPNPVSPPRPDHTVGDLAALRELLPSVILATG